MLADLVALEAHVPPRGLIVELGCGRGLVANMLLEASADREVLGIDPDERRIAAAKVTERQGLRFQVGDARTVALPACDAVAIVDVLYLLPSKDQDRVISSAVAALRPGGRVVIYAQERRADPRFWLGYLQELIATRTGTTMAPGGRLTYASRDEMRARLQSAGLEVEVIPLRGRPYTDAIYVGVKRS
jgi:SAM-dependent methyltransferase